MKQFKVGPIFVFFMVMMVLAACSGQGTIAENPEGEAEMAEADKITCEGEGEEVEISATRLYIEYNATDGDLGVHGGFDDDGWSELCVFAPNGDQILGVRPEAQLGDLTMASIFFEGREPELSEFSFDDLMASFPEGEYAVRALSYDGTILVGAATFTHDVPVEPEITAPELAEDEESAVEVVASTTGFVVTWNDVAETVNRDAARITGYEIIITSVDYEDPNGYSTPVYDVHVSAELNSLSVPAEFFEAGAVYELEVLALEESGNQTISVGFFTTE